MPRMEIKGFALITNKRGKYISHIETYGKLGMYPHRKNALSVIEFWEDIEKESEGIYKRKVTKIVPCIITI